MKKLFLGIATLALLSVASPFFTNNASATVGYGTYADGDALYTLVGPDYFTPSGLGNYHGLTFRIVDTSIADFYNGNDSTTTDMCKNQYVCLQGKKVGETEIIVEQDDEEIDRIPLVSAEMSPEAFIYDTVGKVVNITGSLNGASDELLILESYWPSDSDKITQTGPRSLTIDATTGEYSDNAVYLSWQIGTQWVGFGGEYHYEKISAEDAIGGSSEIEDILLDAWFDIEKAAPGAYIFDWDKDFIGREGNIFRPYRGFSDEYKKIILEETAASVTKTEENKYLQKLPKNINDVIFSNISAKLYGFTKYELSTGGGIEFMAYTPSTDDNRDDNLYRYEMGEFLKLNQSLNISLDVSNTPEPEDGYVRKYYVAVAKNNGGIEIADAEYNAETKRLTFVLDELGTIAYGYIDEEVSSEEEQAETNKKDSTPSVPNTGIAPAKVATTAVATVLPLLGIAGFAFMIRSKNHNDNKLAKKHNHFE